MSEASALASMPAWLWAQPRLLVLLGLLVLAAVLDVRTLRIPNLLTVGGAVLGLLMSELTQPPLGVAAALAGLAVGLTLLLPMHLLGVMGAGDVKLMAMTGTFLGASQTLHAVLFAWLSGGLLALMLVMLRGDWGALLRNLRVMTRNAGFAALPSPSSSLGKLPYGVSICVGTAASVLLRHLGDV